MEKTKRRVRIAHILETKPQSTERNRLSNKEFQTKSILINKSKELTNAKSIDLRNNTSIFDQSTRTKPNTPKYLNFKKLKSNTSVTLTSINRGKKSLFFQSNQSMIDSLAKRKNDLKRSLHHQHQSLTLSKSINFDRKMKPKN